MNNEIVISLWVEKNVTWNSTSSYKGLTCMYYYPNADLLWNKWHFEITNLETNLVIWTYV